MENRSILSAVKTYKRANTAAKCYRLSFAAVRNNEPDEFDKLLGSNVPLVEVHSTFCDEYDVLRDFSKKKENSGYSDTTSFRKAKSKNSTMKKNTRLFEEDSFDESARGLSVYDLSFQKGRRKRGKRSSRIGGRKKRRNITQSSKVVTPSTSQHGSCTGVSSVKISKYKNRSQKHFVCGSTSIEKLNKPVFKTPSIPSLTKKRGWRRSIRKKIIFHKITQENDVCEPELDIPTVTEQENENSVPDEPLNSAGLTFNPYHVSTPEQERSMFTSSRLEHEPVEDPLEQNNDIRMLMEIRKSWSEETLPQNEKCYPETNHSSENDLIDSSKCGSSAICTSPTEKPSACSTRTITSIQSDEVLRRADQSEVPSLKSEKCFFTVRKKPKSSMLAEDSENGFPSIVEDSVCISEQSNSDFEHHSDQITAQGGALLLNSMESSSGSKSEELSQFKAETGSLVGSRTSNLNLHESNTLKDESMLGHAEIRDTLVNLSNENTCAGETDSFETLCVEETSKQSSLPNDRLVRASFESDTSLQKSVEMLNRLSITTVEEEYEEAYPSSPESYKSECTGYIVRLKPLNKKQESADTQSQTIQAVDESLGTESNPNRFNSLNDSNIDQCMSDVFQSQCSIKSVLTTSYSKKIDTTSSTVLNDSNHVFNDESKLNGSLNRINSGSKSGTTNLMECSHNDSISSGNESELQDISLNQAEEQSIDNICWKKSDSVVETRVSNDSNHCRNVSELENRLLSNRTENFSVCSKVDTYLLSKNQEELITSLQNETIQEHSIADSVSSLLCNFSRATGRTKSTSFETPNVVELSSRCAEFKDSDTSDISANVSNEQMNATYSTTCSARISKSADELDDAVGSTLMPELEYSSAKESKILCTKKSHSNLSSSCMNHTESIVCHSPKYLSNLTFRKKVRKKNFEDSSFLDPNYSDSSVKCKSSDSSMCRSLSTVSANIGEVEHSIANEYDSIQNNEFTASVVSCNHEAHSEASYILVKDSCYEAEGNIDDLTSNTNESDSVQSTDLTAKSFESNHESQKCSLIFDSEQLEISVKMKEVSPDTFLSCVEDSPTEAHTHCLDSDFHSIKWNAGVDGNVSSKYEAPTVSHKRKDTFEDDVFKTPDVEMSITKSRSKIGDDAIDARNRAASTGKKSHTPVLSHRRKLQDITNLESPIKDKNVKFAEKLRNVTFRRKQTLSPVMEAQADIMSCDESDFTDCSVFGKSFMTEQSKCFISGGKKWKRNFLVLKNIKEQTFSIETPDTTIRGRNWRSNIENLISKQNVNITENFGLCDASFYTSGLKTSVREDGEVTVKNTTAIAHNSILLSRREDAEKSLFSLEVKPSYENQPVIDLLSDEEYERFNLSSTRSSSDPESSECTTIVECESTSPWIHPSFRMMKESTFVEQLEITAKEIVLNKCGQKQPLPFSECFPDKVLNRCKKIGEGVYGEVFSLKGSRGQCSVLKIIPIEGRKLVNGERQKKFEEIVSEVVISYELSCLRRRTDYCTEVFCELKKCWCVYGQYPKKLIDLWDEYDTVKGSENESPVMFTDEQLYIILELGNGGEDLESYILNSAQQAVSIFKQTAWALYVAEEALEFEHRDLHWGNILISKCTKKETEFIMRENRSSLKLHGVMVTIIDFTLSRATYNGMTIYNNMAQDPGLFAAYGDFQFEVYRLMRDQVNNMWDTFCPKTNVLWLRYVLDKLINNVQYKRVDTKVHKNNMSLLQDMYQAIVSADNIEEIVTSDWFNS